MNRGRKSYRPYSNSERGFKRNEGGRGDTGRKRTQGDLPTLKLKHKLGSGTLSML